MKFAIKADMNGEVLAGELYKIAQEHPDVFTVTADFDIVGHLQSGSFTLTPTANLGIEMLTGKTFVNSDFPLELQVDVNARDWREGTEAEKTEALRSIFKPLVDLYNKTHPSKAEIIQKS
jgi:hypothetical protein